MQARIQAARRVLAPPVNLHFVDMQLSADQDLLLASDAQLTQAKLALTPSWRSLADQKQALAGLRPTRITTSKLLPPCAVRKSEPIYAQKPYLSQ